MTNRYQNNAPRTRSGPELAVPDAVTIAMGEIAPTATARSTATSCGDNFQAGQNYNMYTNLVSYAAGSYDAHFSQSRVCSGTHMATAKKADLTRAAW